MANGDCWTGRKHTAASRALMSVARKKAWEDPEKRARMQAGLREAWARRKASTRTKRQQAILDAVREGRTHAEVAEEFGVSRQRVTEICLAAGMHRGQGHRVKPR